MSEGQIYECCKYAYNINDANLILNDSRRIDNIKFNNIKNYIAYISNSAEQLVDQTIINTGDYVNLISNFLCIKNTDVFAKFLCDFKQSSFTAKVLDAFTNLSNIINEDTRSIFETFMDENGYANYLEQFNEQNNQEEQLRRVINGVNSILLQNQPKFLISQNK